MGEKKVAFHSGSDTVVGVLRVPNNTKSCLAVVLVHGFGSYRDELTGFVELSKKLGISKIASLRIDMRGCGESGRRGHMHPAWDWIEDIHNAISFLCPWLGALDAGYFLLSNLFPV